MSLFILCFRANIKMSLNQLRVLNTRNPKECVFEPCAVKVARTVLAGGKPVRAYLSKSKYIGIHLCYNGMYNILQKCCTTSALYAK